MPFTDPAFEKRRQQLIGGKVSTSAPSIVTSNGFDQGFEQRRAQLLKQGPKMLPTPKIEAPKVVKPVGPIEIAKKKLGDISTGAQNMVKKISKDLNVKFTTPKIDRELTQKIAAIEQKPLTIKPGQKKLTAKQLKQLAPTIEQTQSQSAQLTPAVRAAQAKKGDGKVEKLISKLNAAWNIGVEQSKGNVKNTGALIVSKIAEESRKSDKQFRELAKKHPDIYNEKFFKEREKSIEGYSNTAKRLRDSALKNFQKASEIRTDNLPIDNRKFWDKARDPEWIATSVVETLPNMLTSLGISAATLYATKNPAAALVTGFGSTFSFEAGSAYQDAKNYGADDRTAEKVAVQVGVGAGILEMLPIAKLLNRNPEGQAIKKQMIKEITKKVLVQASLEGGTESMQEIVANAAAKTYDENRDYFAGVPESGLIGSIVGGVSEVGGTGFDKMKAQLAEGEKEKTPKEVIDIVMQTGQEKTDEGKALLKAALEAQNTGQNIVINPEEQQREVRPNTYYRGTNRTDTELSLSKDPTASYGKGIYMFETAEPAKDFADITGNVLTIKSNQPLRLYTPTEEERTTITDLYGDEQDTYIKSLLGDEYDGLRIEKPEYYGTAGEPEIVVYNKDLLTVTESSLKPTTPPLSPTEQVPSSQAQKRAVEESRGVVQEPKVEEVEDEIRGLLYSNEDEAAATLFEENKDRLTYTLEQLKKDVELAQSQVEGEAIAQIRQEAEDLRNSDDPNGTIIKVAEQLAAHFRNPLAKRKITGKPRKYTISDNFGNEKSITVGGTAKDAFDKIFYQTDIEGFKTAMEIFSKKFDGGFTELYNRIKSGDIDGADYENFKESFKEFLTQRPKPQRRRESTESRSRQVEEGVEEGGDETTRTRVQGKDSDQLAASGFAAGGKINRIFSGKRAGYAVNIEMPEMVRIAKELSGLTPVVKEKLIGALGRFYPDKDGLIKLRAEIFKDPNVAAQVLAHEIGHLIDWLPSKTMSRGNLFGRLASLRKFMRQSFTNVSIEEQIDPLAAERSQLIKEREKLKNDISPAAKTRRDEIRQDVAYLSDKIDDLQANSFKLKEVRDELIALSNDWNGIEEKDAGSSYVKGRRKPEELYADAIGVLFNDPAYLKEKAPTFWKLLFDNLDRKPEVQKVLFETWDLLHQGEEAVFKARDEEIEKSFASGEEAFAAKYLDQQKRKTSLWYHIKLLFDDKNTPIKTKINALRKQGKELPADLNPDYALKGLLYSEGELKNYINETFQPVFALAQEVADGWNQLGKIVFYERVIYERGEFANPQGYSPKTAEDQLKQMEKNMSPEDWKKLQEAKEKFRQAVQKSNQLAEDNEYYAPEILAKMKTNPAYAAFQVVDYLDTYITARVYQQKGTLKDIANPATSTVMKLINLHKAVKRNNAKKLNVEFLKNNFTEEIEVAKTKWNGRSMDIQDSKDPDKGLVIVIEDGKPQGYYVDKNISDMLNYTSNETLQAVARVSRAISQSRFYRPLFTVYNLGFQTFNFVRDIRRAWRNMPQRSLKDVPLSPIFDAYRVGAGYIKAIKPAYRRARNKPDALIEEMENSNILGLSYNDIYSGEIDPEMAQIERIFEKTGIIARRQKRNLLTPFKWVLDRLGTVGDFIETLPKVAGYTQLKGTMPKEELSEFVRTSIGSPAFRVGGTFTPVTNNIFLFSNAIKEGIKSDVNVARGKKGKATAAGFWYKTVIGDFLPKFAMAAIAFGLLGEELKKQMDKVSEYDKTNYTIIPLGSDENGKTVYLRIPHDETGRFLAGLLWKSININKDKKTVEDVFDIFSFGAGNFPTLSPSFTGAEAVITYLSGKNPYDRFRNRNVIPDTEFKAGPRYSLPIFLDWLVKNQGGGIFFPTYQPDKPTELEKMLTAPVLSNILGRWVKTSDYGEVEQLKKIESDVEKERSQRNLNERKVIDEAIEEYNKRPSYLKKTELERKIVKELVREDDPSSKKTNTIKKFRMGILRGQNDSRMNSLIDADTNATKVELLKAIEKQISKEAFAELLKTARKERVISSDVIRAYEKSK